MKKEYHNLTDVEKFIVDEYQSWKKSDCPIRLKFEELQKLRVRAVELKIDHLL